MCLFTFYNTVTFFTFLLKVLPHFVHPTLPSLPQSTLVPSHCFHGLCMLAVQERVASMQEFTAQAGKHIETAYMVELLQIPKVILAVDSG